MSFKGFLWRAVLTLFLLVVLYQLWIFIHICWWIDHNPSRSAFMKSTLAEMQAIDPDATLKHKWVEYKRISPNLKRALIAAEDTKFIDHEGFDWEGIQKAYEKNLKKVLPYKISYLSEESKGEGKTLVKMKATHKTDSRAEEILLDVLVQQKDGKFKVIDIFPEGVSTVDSYRTQFVKIYKEKGYDELVKKLKEKIAKGQ